MAKKKKKKKEKYSSEIINLELMEEICTIKTKNLGAFVLANFENSETDGLGNIFIDNGGDILGVAHSDNYGTDYGGNNTHFNIIENRIYNASLDDRAGVYILLDLLPKLNIKCDVLITIDEEIGASSAQLFETEKEYNWMFEFDRTGK
ncbi:unnamed protein product, partial [marine sediment metagenome]